MNQKCPECGCENISLTTQVGEKMCRSCGLVIDDNMIEQPYIPEPVKRQANVPYLAKAGTYSNGNVVKDSWLMTTREKNLRRGRRLIDRISSRLRLPQYVITEANIIFKEAVERSLNIGRDNYSIVYGSVYIACHIHGIPKTPREMTLHTTVSMQKMMKAYRLLKEKLKIKVGVLDPIDLVPRFASKLDLSQKTINKAIEIITKIKEALLHTGKQPQTIVASALYLASKQTGEKRTQREVANCTGVIEVTIRRRIKEFKQIFI